LGPFLVWSGFLGIETLTAARTDHFLKVRTPDFLRLDDTSALGAGGVETGEDTLQINLLAGWHRG